MMRYYLALLFILIIPAFILMVRPGFFPMQDDIQVFRFHQMDACVRDFQIPCRWVPDAGYAYGYPQFNYYSPLPYYVGELFHLIGFQFIDVVKIMFILGFIFSAYAMFFLVNEFFGPFPALVSSVLFTFAPYKASQVYVRGSLSEFWSLIFFPLLFLYSYKIIKKPEKRKYVVAFALSLGAFLTTHNLIPLVFAPLLAVWILYWLGITKKIKSLYPLIVSGLMGFGLSSFFTLPLLFERKFVHVESVLSGYFDYRRHFVDIKQMFFSNHFGYGSSDLGPGDDIVLNSGIVLLTASFLTLLFLHLSKAKKKHKILVSLLAFCELCILFMMHLKSVFVWEKISVLQWLQFPWRLLALSIFVLSFIVSMGVYYSGKYQRIVGVVLILLVFALHGSFFAPKEWLHITDEQKLSGEFWEKQLTISIFDYLPKSAELPPNRKAGDTPEILDGDAQILNYEKHSSLQKGRVSVESETALIRIPLFDFPGMEVRVNDAVVTHTHDNCEGQPYCFGTISFVVPYGIHTIQTRLRNTPIRSLGNIITLVSGLALTVYVTKKNH